MNQSKNRKALGACVAIFLGWSAPGARADQVIADDLIVQGSECVGFDCVNGESFGTDTLRLKENNLRIKFEDTSTTSSFASNDWQLTANEQADGGANKFSLDDITGSKTPFTITAGAATNSIFVDGSGKVGFRTSTPVLDLSVKTSNTPALRLEQDNTGGFTAQTWDIGANEANFFVRDVTGGSKLSLRIRPGAPTSSIDISADGDVGIGTASPDAFLHIERSTGTGNDPKVNAAIRVETTQATEERIFGMVALNNGPVTNAYIDSAGDSNKEWRETYGKNLSTGVSRYELSFRSDSVANKTILQITESGNATLLGTLATGSSRAIKTNIQDVEPETILAAVNRIPIQRWQYTDDAEKSAHIGPMAEDFYGAFGLGADARHISPIDTSGVALASIQALNAKLERQNAELRAENERILGRLEALERRLGGEDPR